MHWSGEVLQCVCLWLWIVNGDFNAFLCSVDHYFLWGLNFPPGQVKSSIEEICCFMVCFHCDSKVKLLKKLHKSIFVLQLNMLIYL